MVLVGGENLMALSIKLRTTCSIRTGSTVAVGRCAAARTRKRRSPARGVASATTRRIRTSTLFRSDVAAGARAAEIEQVVDESAQPVGLAVDVQQQLPRRLGVQPRAMPDQRPR